MDRLIDGSIELDWPTVRARFAARARGATDGGGDDELELSPPTDADPRLTVVSNLPFSLTRLFVHCIAFHSITVQYSTEHYSTVHVAHEVLRVFGLGLACQARGEAWVAYDHM